MAGFFNNMMPQNMSPIGSLSSPVGGMPLQAMTGMQGSQMPPNVLALIQSLIGNRGNVGAIGAPPPGGMVAPPTSPANSPVLPPMPTNPQMGLGSGASGSGPLGSAAQGNLMQLLAQLHANGGLPVGAPPIPPGASATASGMGLGALQNPQPQQPSMPMGLGLLGMFPGLMQGLNR